MSEKIDDGKVLDDSKVEQASGAEKNLIEKTDDSKAIDDSKSEQAIGGYEEPAVQSNGNDAETNGVFFVPVFFAANANVVVNTNITFNLATTANVTVATNTNTVANVNVATNTNTED